jgi:hypothetical protein
LQKNGLKIIFFSVFDGQRSVFTLRERAQSIPGIEKPLEGVFFGAKICFTKIFTQAKRN